MVGVQSVILYAIAKKKGPGRVTPGPFLTSAVEERLGRSNGGPNGV